MSPDAVYTLVGIVLGWGLVEGVRELRFRREMRK